MANSVQLVPMLMIPDFIHVAALDLIHSFSISMVASSDGPESQQPCSGVLATINGVRGILTARHVSEAIRRASTLSLLMGNRRYQIARTLLSFVHPEAKNADNPWHAKVPDISFIPLAALDAREIESFGKAFYNVDRRSVDTAFDLYGEDGFFIAIGCPDGLANRDAGQLVQLRFMTDLDLRTKIDDWDYLVVNLNLERNPSIPDSLAGMSGGGVWRVRFEINNAGEFSTGNVSRNVSLAGITFWETELTDRQLVAHGPFSIYDSFPSYFRSVQIGGADSASRGDGE